MVSERVYNVTVSHILFPIEFRKATLFLCLHYIFQGH